MCNCRHGVLDYVFVCAGKIVHYMTGHQDAVTGLAIDYLGQYLLSGGEYKIILLLMQVSTVVRTL